MPLRRVMHPVGLAALLGVVLSATGLQAQTVPTGFVVERIIGPPFGGEPVGFTWLPDGRVMLIERDTGIVRLAAAGASTSVQIFTVPNVSTQIERGLLGIAIDPNWPSRPYVYLSYTRTDSLSILVLYRASGDLTNSHSTNITLGSPYIMLETPDLNAYHNSGTIRFGLDGRLYLTWGDDGTPCQAQDLTVLNGKLMRLDVSRVPRSGGGPPSKSFITPPDNPFSGSPNLNTRLLYAWGLRNPFRFTVDRTSGVLYLGDVGEDAFEEIDRVSTNNGPDFGWPIREGPNPAGLGYTCGSSNTFTDPIYAYPHVEPASFAVIGGPLYRYISSSVSLPASYDGSYFFLEWGGQWIRRLVLVGGVWQVAPAVPGQPTADHWGEGFTYFSDFQEGSDGALYVEQHGGGGGLFRIRRATGGGTSAPVAAAPATALEVHAQPNPATAGRGVEFQWSSPRAGRVELTVYDAAGRAVTKLSGAEDASRGVLTWNGRDAQDSPVAAGVYFYRLKGPMGSTARGRVTIVR